MGNEKEQKEREKYRSTDLARILLSVIIFILSKEIEIVNTLMGFYVIISILWMLVSEKYPLFQNKYPFTWLIPASLDVFNSLMIIYVTGSAYSTWILSLPFITALSASDPLKWRGIYTAVAGAAGLAIMLILVQVRILPFTDIWKINYRPHSWSLVVQAILLNTGVSLFLRSAIYKINKEKSI